MKKVYSPQSFLTEFASDKYVFQAYDTKKLSVNLSRFKTWKNMKVFLKYLECFINIAFDNDIKVNASTKDRVVKCYKFKYLSYEFQLLVSFRVDFEVANNRLGMDKCFVIDHMTLEAVERIRNIEIKYAKFTVYNRFEKLFKKFLKQIRKFIQHSDYLNAWFILHGINAERIKEVCDGV